MSELFRASQLLREAKEAIWLAQTYLGPGDLPFDGTPVRAVLETAVNAVDQVAFAVHRARKGRGEL